MFDWHYYARLPDYALAGVDIALLNLACADGLPGCDGIDLPAAVSQLDDWADRCRKYTDRVMPMFRAGRCDYPESEPMFRVQAMITHLQRDLGIRFRPDRRSDTAVYEPADSFLTGILKGTGGTCGSLPVLYTAVGRRLGYPIQLAATRCHLYCRWDDGPLGEEFNIEGAGDGVSFLPDDYYRTGHYQMPPETVAACGFLRSHSPREDLAGFLVERGECWRQENNFGEAVMAYAWANELAPHWEQLRILIVQGLRLWDAQLRSRLVPGFPKLDLGIPAQQFQHLPARVEKEMIRMRVQEGVMNDPGYERTRSADHVIDG